MTKRAWRIEWLELLVCASMLSACPSTPPVERTWSIEQEHLPGAILSMWGSSPSDIFAAGGPLAADGGMAVMLHYDGASWQPMTLTGTTLWWVFGFTADDVWSVGEHGIILHYDGSTWATVEPPSQSYTLWGIWGASPTDLWTVGGVAAGGAPSVIRHYDGTTWTDVADVGLPSELLFKVWGTRADDVWIVGTGGATVHWDGAVWTRVESGTTARLLTVRGRASDDIYAVGGLGTPTVIHYDGTSWSPVAVDAFGGLMGIWTAPDHGIGISGERGVLMAHDGHGWAAAADYGPTELDLHCVWGDGTGKLYASGGNLFSSAVPDGIIVSSETP